MKLTKTRTIIGWLAISVLVLLTAACGNEPDTSVPRTTLENSGSFTFFGIGKSTPITAKIRADLENILGDAAIENRGVLDLAMNSKTFLEEHFPELDRMNRQLNSEIGLQVKHRIVRHMYRYAKPKGLPYDLVEIFYSETSEKPLLIRLQFKTDGDDTLKTLEQKYGPSDTLAWGPENGSTRFWQKEGDYLFFSIVPIRGNVVEYRIDIYFTAAIEALIQAEKAETDSQASSRTGF